MDEGAPLIASEQRDLPVGNCFGREQIDNKVEAAASGQTVDRGKAQDDGSKALFHHAQEHHFRRDLAARIQ